MFCNLFVLFFVCVFLVVGLFVIVFVYGDVMLQVVDMYILL